MCSILSPFILIMMLSFFLKSTVKAVGDCGIKWAGKILINLDFVDDFNILDESASKMNEILEALRVQSPRIGSKINYSSIKSLRLSISEGEEMMLDNENNDEVDSIIYLGNIIEDVKSRIAKTQGVNA